MIAAACCFGSPAYGQSSGSTPQLVDIHHKAFESFTRVVLDFDRPVQQAFEEDWAERTLICRVAGAQLSDRLQRGIYPIRTAQITSVRLDQRAGRGVAVEVQSPEEYVMIPVPLRDPNRIVFDMKLAAGLLTAEEYYQRGLQYEQRGDPRKALEELKSAICLKPGYPEAYFRAGVIRLMMGDTQRALVNFRQVPRNTPLGRETQDYILAMVQPEPAAPAPRPVERKTAVKEPVRHAPPEEQPKRDAPVLPDPVAIPLTWEEEPEPAYYMHHQLVLDAANPAKTVLMNPSPADDIPLDPAVETPVAAAPVPATPARASGWTAALEVHRSLDPGLAAVVRYWYVTGPVALLLMIAGFLLARRAFGRKRTVAHARKPAKELHPVYEKALREEIESRRLRAGTAPPNAFARRLSQTYRMTDAAEQAVVKPEREKPREQVEHGIRMERQREIEDALRDMMPAETAGDRSRTAVSGFVPKEKYLAVYRLTELGWSPSRIASQLNLEMEEVALALEMAPPAGDAKPDGQAYQRARALHREGRDLRALARELNVGTGELEMAASFDAGVALPSRSGRTGGRR